MRVSEASRAFEALRNEEFPRHSRRLFELLDNLQSSRISALEFAGSYASLLEDVSFALEERAEIDRRADQADFYRDQIKEGVV